MSRVILRQIFSAKHELPWMKMAIRELEGIVDEVVVTESSFTHTGSGRRLAFGRELWGFRQLFGDVSYVPVSDEAMFRTDPRTPADLHHNETVVRGAWAADFSLRPNDVVIAVDADEVVSRQAVQQFLSERRRRQQPHQLRLRQLFWSPHNLWFDANFVAPVITRARSAKTFPNDWRYFGDVQPGCQGWHFSWCLTVDQMLEKLSRYSHAIEFAAFRDRATLEQARTSNSYVFDSERSFSTRWLSEDKMQAMMPASYWEFRHEIPTEVLMWGGQ